MSDYLEPVTDGLELRDSGPWAANKLDYLARYIEMFETSMRDKWVTRNYIDLFSGPGKNIITDTGQILLGSPLLALKATHPFSGYFFADYEQDNIAVLETRCASSPLYNRITMQAGDSNRIVHSFVDRIKKIDPLSLNLAFLDPEGLELRWTTVAALGALYRMDLIIHYSEHGLNRNMGQMVDTPDDNIIDLFFGTRQWRDIYKAYFGGARLHENLIQLYRTNLVNSLGYKDVKNIGPFGHDAIIRNSRQAILYRLIFASKHPLGNAFWQKVIGKEAGGQMRLPLDG